MAAAQTRLEPPRRIYARDAGSRLLGRLTQRDFELSPYLLSGLSHCEVCGGSLIGMTRSHGTGRKRGYVCSCAYRRGSAVCANHLQIPQATLDSAVLHAIHEVLDERVVALAIEKALARVRGGKARLTTSIAGRRLSGSWP